MGRRFHRHCGPCLYRRRSLLTSGASGIRGVTVPCRARVMLRRLPEPAVAAFSGGAVTCVQSWNEEAAGRYIPAPCGSAVPAAGTLLHG